MRTPRRKSAKRAKIVLDVGDLDLLDLFAEVSDRNRIRAEATAANNALPPPDESRLEVRREGDPLEAA